jgi:hypothetical protein
MVRHEMAFHDLALMLSRQIVEDLTQMPAKFPIKHASAVLGDEDYVVFALPAGVT